MRNSTQLDSLAALEEIAPRRVITSSDIPVILSLRSADNDASHEDPAISNDKVEPRAQHSLAGNGFGDVATTNTASSAWPMSYQLLQAARAHRSYILGQAIAAAIQTTVAIARRALARHRQRRQARVAYDALRQLDDRTLRDLGFDRSEIMSVAAEVAGEAECTRVRALPNAIGSAAAVTNRITAWGNIEMVSASHEEESRITRRRLSAHPAPLDNFGCI
jgi:uncharacterized protein YjiS (DUF1127 family)